MRIVRDLDRLRERLDRVAPPPDANGDFMAALYAGLSKDEQSEVLIARLLSVLEDSAAREAAGEPLTEQQQAVAKSLSRCMEKMTDAHLVRIAGLPGVPRSVEELDAMERGEQP